MYSYVEKVDETCYKYRTNKWGPNESETVNYSSQKAHKIQLLL